MSNDLDTRASYYLDPMTASVVAAVKVIGILPERKNIRRVSHISNRVLISVLWGHSLIDSLSCGLEDVVVPFCVQLVLATILTFNESE